MVYIDFKSGNWRFVQATTGGFALVQKFKTKSGVFYTDASKIPLRIG